MKNKSLKNCLNIGAGLSSGKSWLSFDSSPTLLISKIPVLGGLLLRIVGGPEWPKSTQYGDIVLGLPIESETCEIIFCSHTLEHLSYLDADKALSNICSYLKKGGVLRLIVPDLEVYVKRYIGSLEQSKNEASVDFIKNTNLGHAGSRLGFLNRLREAFTNSRHQWLWDTKSLLAKLKEIGFKDLKICQFKEWSDSRFIEVEDHGRHEDSICIEAKK
jgi:predicted SAM-dependent methyltransferase